jgi:surfeit locus 1 family protein
MGSAEAADPAALGRLLWRRVDTAGVYDPDREVVVRGRTWEGSPGVELLTPLALEGGREIWVDRGWVPSPDAEHVDRSRFVERGPVRVQGFLRPSEHGEAPPGGGPPAVLEQLPDAAHAAPPVRRGPPELSNGPHLSYAVQWFAFAATALVGYAALLWSRRGRRLRSRPRRDDEHDAP